MKIESIEYTPIFRRGFKRAKKKHLNMDKLTAVIELIMTRKTEILINNYRDHALTGSHKGLRELHIEKD
ncbi:MAG: type II toxin-antitoxin system YafQ family toxin [Enterococcus sp.]